ncbi:hypothetical protein D3C75_470670 [compost metagenome]
MAKNRLIGSINRAIFGRLSSSRVETRRVGTSPSAASPMIWINCWLTKISSSTNSTASWVFRVSLNKYRKTITVIPK